MNQYPHPHRILVAIDCIILGFDGEELKLLLIKRNFEPEKGRWSLMGGFLRADENLEDGAKRILYDLTGIQDLYVEQLQAYGNIGRDPVERTISIVFFALVNLEDYLPQLNDKRQASWISLNALPELIFDHKQMVDAALDRLRYKAALHPLGLELLPDKFSIPQLQKLYEAIYGVPLDRRNFRRKFFSTELLIDTGEKDGNSVTKKASLYRLDPDKYRQKFHSILNFMPDRIFD